MRLNRGPSSYASLLSSVLSKSSLHWRLQKENNVGDIYVDSPFNARRQLNPHNDQLSILIVPLFDYLNTQWSTPPSDRPAKMAAAEVAVDFAYLSTHLGVPETTLTTVASQPTPDLVISVLQAVIAKAHDFDALYTEKLQIDIELENAVRSSEARCQTFKATADKALKDVEEVRKKLQNEGERPTSNASLAWHLCARALQMKLTRACPA